MYTKVGNKSSGISSSLQPSPSEIFVFNSFPLPPFSHYSSGLGGERDALYFLMVVLVPLIFSFPLCVPSVHSQRPGCSQYPAVREQCGEDL